MYFNLSKAVIIFPAHTQRATKEDYHRASVANSTHVADISDIWNDASKAAKKSKARKYATNVV